MLTKKQRTVLRALLKIDGRFSEKDLLDRLCGMSRDDALATLQELFDLDYIRMIERNSRGEVCSVVLDSLARNFDETRRMERVALWKERGYGFVIGFVSGVLAAYAFAWLTSL